MTKENLTLTRLSLRPQRRDTASSLFTSFHYSVVVVHTTTTSIHMQRGLNEIISSPRTGTGTGCQKKTPWGGPWERSAIPFTRESANYHSFTNPVWVRPGAVR